MPVTGSSRARENDRASQEIEDGDGGVELAAEERALEAGFVLLTLLQGKIGAGGDERDELRDGLGGAAEGGIGVDFLGEDEDAADAAGGGAVTFLEGGERRRGGGGVVGRGCRVGARCGRSAGRRTARKFDVTSKTSWRWKAWVSTPMREVFWKREAGA
jgi:hypothetical protein